MNLNQKGSLTGKNMDKNKNLKINFNQNLSPFKTPLGSPKNISRGNLILQNELSNFNAGYKTNRRANFHLPNLLKERTISPTFRNRLKLKNPDVDLNDLDSGIFVNDVDALIDGAKSRLMALDPNILDLFDISDCKTIEDFIDIAIARLENKYGNLYK